MRIKRRLQITKIKQIKGIESMLNVEEMPFTLFYTVTT
jgi:hypothetical protein